MRNFYSILACLFLFLPIDLSAQKFEYSYDFPGSDAGNDVAELSDGSIITVGLSNSYGAGGNDIMVMKTSSSGTLLWIKYFGGTGDDGGNAVTIGANDEIYCAGYGNPRGKNPYSDDAGRSTYLMNLLEIFLNCGLVIKLEIFTWLEILQVQEQVLRICGF